MNSISKNLGMNKSKSRFLGWLVKLLSFTPYVNKGYGGISYSMEASRYVRGNYVIVEFDKAIGENITMIEFKSTSHKGYHVDRHENNK